MNIDFAAVLVGLTLLTGGIWLLDALVLARRRHPVGVVRDGDRDGAVAADAVRAVQLPWYVDLSKSFFPVILAVLLLRSFVVEPFRIPSESMVPTLLKGDFILVNKFAYGLRLPVLNHKIAGSGAPARGDVIVFRWPGDPGRPANSYQSGEPKPGDAYIKRVIGLPGDHLAYRNKQLFINGQPASLTALTGTDAAPGYQVFEEHLAAVQHRVQMLADPRWRWGSLWPGLQVRREADGTLSWEYPVPAGHYFVMGDNRDNSSDSRVWGTVPEANLIGRAFLIWMNGDCLTFNGHCGRIGSSIR